MNDVHVYRCLCGARSPALATKKLAYDWHTGHKKEACTAVRRSSLTRASRSAPVGRARLEAELAELAATAKKYKPIPVGGGSPTTWRESTEWTDTARDRWGAPARGLLARTWSQGNCLKACIASVLGASIERVPDPSVEFNQGLDGWLERYDKRLREATGYRLERLPASCCPPRNNQLWLATIRMDGPADHVVVARNHYVVHDPLGEFVGLVPMRRLVDGMTVAPTRRAVPVFSNIHAIASA